MADAFDSAPDLKTCLDACSQQEVQSQVEDAQHARDEAREAVVAAERRYNLLNSECEELRASLEVSERARKVTEGECQEASDRINELSAQLGSVAGQKRKLETDISAMQVRRECDFINILLLQRKGVSISCLKRDYSTV